MARISFRVNDKFTVTGEGNTHKEAWADLAGQIEITSIDKCGKCGRESIYPVHRTVGKFQYYELRCRNCHHKLSFGQSTENGNLYPRRKYHEKHPLVKQGKAKEKDPIPNGGWEYFNKDDQATEEE